VKNRRSLPVSALLRLGAGCALAACGSGAAFAQDTSSPSEEALDEVVVTGFRASLEAALAIKRDSIGPVDAIVAEDIAKFPDLNLAEAIQRVPGVSIQRDAGEGRQISVRGLGPEFTRIRLNGVEAMSANGGTDAAGGTNRARNFDFNTFASELFNSITVRKAASAGTDEGSLGATVDLRTARPFDYDGFTLVTSITGAYNDLAEDFDPRAAFLISDTFADDKAGALLSVAYTKRGLVDEGSSTVRWTRASGIALAAGYAGPNLFPDPAAPTVSPYFVPRIPRYDYYEHDQDRLGITAALQFRPAESTEINLEGLYSKFDAERREVFLEVPNFSSGIGSMRVQDAQFDANNSIVYGVFNNVDIRVENRFDELSTEFRQLTLSGAQHFGERFTVNGLVGYAESDHDNPVQTTLTFDRLNIPSLTYDFRDDNRLPVISYGSTDLISTVNGNPMAAATVDSNGWFLSQIRIRPQTSFNSFLNYQADVQWEFTDALRLEVGAQMKDYTFRTTERRRSNGTNTNLEATLTAAQQAVPLTDYGTVFAFGSDLGIPSGSNTQFLIPDLDRAAAVFSLYDPAVFPLGPEPSLNNNRSVEEDDSAAFVQLDFTTELGGRRVRGDIGVRYVKTEQVSNGFTFVSGAPLLVRSERDYTDTLPALNLALDVTDEFIVRLGAAKVMSRPALGILTPGGTVNVSGNNRVAALGNPGIDPTRATNYDLGLEWYFARESLLSLALFYKDIESRPQGISLTSQVFTGNPFGIPDSVAVAACGAIANCAPELPIWTFNTTANGDGGELKGFEFSYQQPFTFLPGFWSNFGAIFNYTGVESTIQYINPLTTLQETADLTGLSKRAYNATLYYETQRFGARVSAAFRDEYLDPVNGAPGRDGNVLEGVAEALTIDASLRYKVNDSIEMSLEGLNLTDEFQDQWVDAAANRLSFYHHTGRNYLLGVRVKF
jgi:iron complex outermembrane receptor protein